LNLLDPSFRSPPVYENDRVTIFGVNMILWSDNQTFNINYVQAVYAALVFLKLINML